MSHLTLSSVTHLHLTWRSEYIFEDDDDGLYDNDDNNDNNGDDNDVDNDDNDDGNDDDKAAETGSG